MKLLPLAALASASLASASDFERFLSYWPGTYDNLAQVSAQAAASRDPADRNIPTRLYIAEVDLPAFGRHVYYAEWQSTDTPPKVTRQRLYSFSVGGQNDAFRLGLHIWPNNNPEFVAKTAGAHADPPKLSGVMPEDMAGIAGCDVLFASAGEAYGGAMVKGACAFDAPNGKPIYSWSQMKISANAISYLDGWFNPDGTPIVRFPGEWYVFEKRN